MHGDPATADESLVRVHVKNHLGDLLHLERADLGISLATALDAIARAPCGIAVVLAAANAPDDVLARLRGEADTQAAAGPAEWRRNGVGAQILADLGAKKLRVLGTPRRQVALAGFGLEVVAYVEPGTLSVPFPPSAA